MNRPALILTAFILTFSFSIISGEAIASIIPDVTGLSQEVGEENIRAAGFEIGWVTTGYSDAVAEGNIIRQSAVGTAPEGTVVDLVVSLGTAGAGIDEAPCNFGGDINDDCAVDLADLRLVAEQWLLNYDMADFAAIPPNWQDWDSPVIIYEFMASNSGILLDEDGESSDWIEIYNRSGVTVDMTGWYLTDDSDQPDKWQFSRGPVLGPGEYAVIFASGNSAVHFNHTNFKLSSGGEYLGLCRPDVSAAYEYGSEYPDQNTDVSYGLFAGETRYFANPTPGRANEGGYFGIVADTNFSIDRGFYDSPFEVAITCDDPEAKIWYTTNSEEPTEATGTEYTGPVRIAGTTVLKAKATRPGWLSSNVDTQTYIFVSDVKYQSDTAAPGAGWPDPGDARGILCNNGTQCGNLNYYGILQYMDYGMDPEIVGPLAPGVIESALKAIPSISISTDTDNLFDEQTGIFVNAYGDGREWERPASMELIHPDGTEGFQIDMGLRIRGGWSRQGGNPKHAFRCFFRSEYGEPRLEYPLFGNEGVDEFDKIDLRADQNYSWAFCGDYRSTFCHEVFTRDTQGDMGQPYTRSRYYHLYLNGHYWGLFQTQERSEANYAASYMGGQSDDYDVVKTSDAHDAAATDGDMRAYERLYNAAVGTGFADNADYYRAQGKNPDGTDNPDYEKLVDIDNVIDYNLMCYWFGGIDYPLGLKNDGALNINNLYAIYNRNNPDGWKFFIHDAEHTFGLREGGGGADRTRWLNFGSNYTGYTYFNPVWLHQELAANAEYRMAFADAVYKHMFNGGALSEAKCFERLAEREVQAGPAVIAESARWGDVQKHYMVDCWVCGTIGGDSVDPVRYSDWENTAMPRMRNWMNGRTAKVFGWIRNRNWLGYPSINPPLLKINGVYKYGGYITVPDTLTLANPNGGGTVYYTLDGSDPRQTGGAVNPAALSGAGPVTLSKTTHVKARVKYGSTWSALADAVYGDDRVVSSIRVSEIMYNPGDPDTEFIELKNISAESINLNLVKFTDGIDFTFGDYLLNAGDYAVVVENRAAFEAKYGTGLNVAGEYRGSLSNGGEEIVLRDARGAEIHDFDYKDGWYELTDGLGYSLTMVNPESSDLALWDAKSGWRSSLNAGGTPSDAALSALPAGCIVINEVLAHSHGGSSDWIELHNTTADQSIDISGWFLSDDDSDLNMIRKYQIPENTVIHAGGYKVFIGDNSFDDQTPVGSNVPFGLSEGGETVYLYSGQDGEVTGLYQTQQKFDASNTDVTLGRYEKAELSGGYDFVPLSSPTPGYANSGPRIPDVVITEINYNSPNGSDFDYVELYNRSGNAVALMEYVQTETSPDVFITENIPWRLEGTGFEFGANITIGAKSYILVAKNPSNYSSAPCDVYGPYDGKLSNGGEQLEIQIPGDLEYGKDRYWIPVEKVDYDDESPWPVTPDGGGDSLHRINTGTYGRDYSNWNAMSPTPGY